MSERRALTGWGRTAGSVAEVVQSDAAGLGDVLKEIGPRGIIARGLGRSYGDPAQNAGGQVLLPLPASIEIDQATGFAQVSAGVSLHDLMRHLLPMGRYVAVTPGTRSVTIGGALACDVHGKSHHRTGTFGAQTVSLDLVTADGALHTVSPEKDPELFWATIGGLGLTGVIVAATLRTIEVGSAWMSVDTRSCADLDETLTALREADERFTYSVAWIDTLAGGRKLGRSVLSCGEHARPDELTGAAARDPWRLPRPARISAPRAVPPHLVSRPGIKVFNELWFRKAPAQREGELQTQSAFFHPLDGIGDWNRLYGRQGFLQYQYVVPDTAEAAVRESLELISGHGQASFLAVLKRFGKANPGLLSFPTAGWTLALDLPMGTGLSTLLAELDRLVIAAGGRVYLAKDSRLDADTVRAMYPRIPEFEAIRDRVDPERRFVSDLSRRLNL